MADINQIIARLDDYRTRARARLELKKLADQAAPKLLELLQDEAMSDNARWATMTVLGSCRHKPAITALLNIVRTNGSLRSEANRTLEQITGRENAAENADEWERILGGQLDDIAAPATKKSANDPVVSDSEAYAMVRKAVGNIATEMSWCEEGYAYLRLQLTDERKHQVIVNFDETDSSGRAVVCVYTECGPASPQALEMIYSRNVTLQYGKFGVEKEDNENKVVIRHYLPVEIVTTDLLRDVIIYVAHEADNLELELTGSDQI